ncbi:Alpha/beta knot methyltransferase [Ostreococcus tauri]|uniref:rRNA methyltransferase 1, mitochondrial n=1 Tax=Ostreococcus tauri TaxID=70448 RepID=A0A1Y5I650_OSTTA|nr:Alpha/beta knot methyltransferase [Ostreococcus tauri]
MRAIARGGATPSAMAIARVVADARSMRRPHARGRPHARARASWRMSDDDVRDDTPRADARATSTSERTGRTGWEGRRAREVAEDARRRGTATRYDRRAIRRERGDGPTIAEGLIGEMVYGTNPVLEALRQNRRTLFALYVQTGEGGGGHGTSEILRLAKELKVEVKSASKHDLNMACDNKPHQGVLLDAEALEIPTVEELPRWNGVGSPPVWLALDEVVDPQNLGAMLRSAHFLGVDGIVVCTKNSAPFNATVSKASAGAMEAQVVHRTGVMHRFLARARDDGWDVVGAAADPRAENIHAFEVAAPTVLVVGNEGVGIRTNVRRACNRLVSIPRGVSATDGVDSLNVSVAAGILIHALLASRTV